MHGVVVDIPLKNRAGVLRWKLIALINLDAGVRSHLVLVIVDRMEELVGVGIGRLPGLAVVNAAGHKVKRANANGVR